MSQIRIKIIGFAKSTNWTKIRIILAQIKPTNTLRARLSQAVRKKQLIRTWLCGWISPLLFALATRRKSQKAWPVK